MAHWLRTGCSSRALIQFPYQVAHNSLQTVGLGCSSDGSLSAQGQNLQHHLKSSVWVSVYNLSTWCQIRISRALWATLLVPGQSGLHRPLQFYYWILCESVFSLHVYIYCDLPACMHTICVPSALRGQKRTPDALELTGFRGGYSCLLGAGN